MLDLYLVKDEEEGAIFTYLKKKEFFSLFMLEEKIRHETQKK
jgi:hypothetical protein